MSVENCLNCFTCQKMCGICYTCQQGYSGEPQSQTPTQPPAQNVCPRPSSPQPPQKPNFVPEKITNITIWNTALCDLHCSYCERKGTRILMADLTWKKVEDIVVGDEVVGFWRREDEVETRIRKAKVLAVNRRVADVYRIETDAGEIFVTENHAFLKQSGKKPRWKAINPETARLGGVEGHIGKLEEGERIKFLLSPVDVEESEQYMLGYLCGIFEGDGTRTEKRYSGKTVRHARLAMKDDEALERVKKYLQKLGIKFSEGIHKYNSSWGYKGEIKKITLYKIDDIEKIYRRSDDKEWLRGFVAGMFDAEGSFNRNMRIYNQDDELLELVMKGLNAWNILFDKEKFEEQKEKSVRIKTLRECLKFFTIFRPAISRKMKYLWGKSVHLTEVNVKNVKYEGREEVYSLMVEGGVYVTEGYISHNCFIYSLYPNQPRKSVSDEVIDALPKFVKKYMVDRPSIWFFGGEPLVSFDTIVKIYNKIAENDIVASFGLTTNLTLMDEGKAKWLAERNFGILCSIDGGKESHDANRVYSDGRGSWNDVMRGLEYVRLYINHIPQIRWTVLPNNFKNLSNDIISFIKLGLINLAIDPVYEVEWKDEDIEYYVNELEKVAKILVKSNVPVMMKPFQDLLPLFSPQRSEWRSRCGLAQGSLAMDINGDLHLCHRFVASRTEFSKIGDIFNGIDEEKRRKINEEFWKTKPYNKSMNCLECPLDWICSGGCLAVNFDMCNSLNIVPDTYCRINRRVAEKLLPYVQIMRNKNQIRARIDKIYNQL